VRISASETAGAAALAALVGTRIGLDMVTGFSVRRTLGSPHFKSF
jgi:NAD(P)H-hydrate repair Nnr-like enzyme with NAD(P)H-hydrate dehydratase domain